MTVWRHTPRRSTSASSRSLLVSTPERHPAGEVDVEHLVGPGTGCRRSRSAVAGLGLVSSLARQRAPTSRTSAPAGARAGTAPSSTGRPVIAAISSAVCCAAAAGPSRPVRTASSIAWSWAETVGREALQAASPHGREARRSARGNRGRARRARLPSAGTGIRPVVRAIRASASGATTLFEQAHRERRLRRLPEDSRRPSFRRRSPARPWDRRGSGRSRRDPRARAGALRASSASVAAS